MSNLTSNTFITGKKTVASISNRSEKNKTENVSRMIKMIIQHQEQDESINGKFKKPNKRNIYQMHAKRL